MKHLIKVTFLLISGLLLFGHLRAQDTTSIASFFDDGDISKSNQAIKINVLQFIQKDYHLIYQNIYNDWFEFDIGAGYLSKGFDYLMYSVENAFYNEDLELPSSGFSLMVNPKLYMGDIRHAYYFGILWKYRSFPELSTSDYEFNVGLRKLIGHHWLLVGGLGLGMRVEENSDGIHYLIDPDPEGGKSKNIYLPIHIHIGYTF